MAKEVYGWDYPDFTVPEEVAARFHQTMIEEGQKLKMRGMKCLPIIKSLS